MTQVNPWFLLFFSWLIALLSSVGSLFFSEVMEFQPCSLCWYQRIAMYPLAVILLVGLFPIERKTFNFAMPLAVIGWLIALYHNLIHLEIIPESASPCVQGIPCSAIWINWLGFITIPILSFTAFTCIIVLLVLFRRNLR